MTKALRGINLGGWLITETWMTPDVFNGTVADSERELGLLLGDASYERLNTHRDSFITVQDFKWIADHGFDFVRLPVGYWLFEPATGFLDGERYVKQAFEWAQKYRLGVVLDFHGLQGSQNGNDHSGQTGRVRFYRGKNRSRALSTLEYLCRTYGKREELLGIEIINEPKTGLLWPLLSWRRLLRYYDDALALATPLVKPEAKLIVSDSFKPLKMARALRRRGYGGGRVVLDIHLYQVYSRKDKALNFQSRIEKVEKEWAGLLIELNEFVPVMVGEWSAALPGNPSVQETNRYFQVQQSVYEHASWAHAYWSYKAPGAGAWDYRSLKK